MARPTAILGFCVFSSQHKPFGASLPLTRARYVARQLVTGNRSLTIGSRPGLEMHALLAIREERVHIEFDRQSSVMLANSNQSKVTEPGV